MNNFKLEVLRINEDVIATSCSNPSYPHAYITNIQCDGSVDDKHYYGIFYGTDGEILDSGCIDDTIYLPGWYYTTDAFVTLEPCNGSHNFDTSTDKANGYGCTNN